jgi:hypothetical protein
MRDIDPALLWIGLALVLAAVIISLAQWLAS